MLTLHYMVSSLLVPTLLWCSEVWWTGALHIVDNRNPIYLRFARLITNQQTRTGTDRLLAAISLPLLKPLLNFTSRRYGLRLLSTQDTPTNPLS